MMQSPDTQLLDPSSCTSLALSSMARLSVCLVVVDREALVR